MKRSAKQVILDEHERALKKFGKFPTPHHGFAVTEEEFLEFRNEVFWGRDSDLMEQECVQLAAMVYRFLIDICGMDP